MCAVRGTKLYGLRIKKEFLSKNKYQKNIFNGFDLILKKDWLNFEWILGKKIEYFNSELKLDKGIFN